MIFNEITKFIYNNFNLVLDENQKTKLQSLIKKYSEEQIKKSFKNYKIIKNQFIFDEIVKKEVFEKYLNYEKKEILPDYLDQLSKEAKEDLLNCHDEIMYKCCAMVGKKYDLLIEKLFRFFTLDKIPFWCMSGVLYHDIFRYLPVRPIKIIAEMNKRDNFINLCRVQYKKVQKCKQKNKNIFNFDKKLNNESIEDRKRNFFSHEG